MWHIEYAGSWCSCRHEPVVRVSSGGRSTTSPVHVSGNHRGRSIAVLMPYPVVGSLVSGSVKVLSDGPIGGGVRYGVPEIGVAGVGASPPVRDVLFPARRQEGGIRTATALHNLGAEAVGVSCRLMSGGVSLEEVEIPLEANGRYCQVKQFGGILAARRHR